MMLESARQVAALKPHCVKLHLLHVLKNTRIAKELEAGAFRLLKREEYVDIVCDELELLREDIVINRITGDPNKNLVIEPTWLIKKFGVLNEIDKEMERRNSYQGIKYEDILEN